MVTIFFSNLFEKYKNQFLFGNFDKLSRSIALFLSQNVNKNLIFSIENYRLCIVYTTIITTLRRRQRQADGPLVCKWLDKYESN